MSRASRPTDYLPAALDYVKRGWPVFPLVAGGKQPRVSRGFHRATTDRDVVIAWWSQWPDSNIGLATGHLFDVLDVDGEVGEAALKAFLAEKGLDGYRHSGPVALTGKGLHLFYQPTGALNGQNLVEKVDFRGEGGYVVAPPSLHPLGHHYRWDKARGPEAPLPPAPLWLAQLLASIRQKRDYLPPEIRAVHEAEKLTRGAMKPDIYAVAQELGLSLSMRSHYALTACPFHEDSTPSLALYPAPKNNFTCYGCGAYGDSYDLRARRDINGKTF
jgi:hypothetical protein